LDGHAQADRFSTRSRHVLSSQRFAVRPSQFGGRRRLASTVPNFTVTVSALSTPRERGHRDFLRGGSGGCRIIHGARERVGQRFFESPRFAYLQGLGIGDWGLERSFKGSWSTNSDSRTFLTAGDRLETCATERAINATVREFFQNTLSENSGILGAGRNRRKWQVVFARVFMGLSWRWIFSGGSTLPRGPRE
jgi:hypothetical protein